ncbi:hypothetical protein WJX72_002158 [[Myrmecia] bisecta]|uniref:RING-type E3 ubiquitin transferase n=1 Tax=[Myrmecia] bisecta TaxID=41462 RepID=A0AAW1R5C5_9CHLO
MLADAGSRAWEALMLKGCGFIGEIPAYSRAEDERIQNVANVAGDAAIVLDEIMGHSTLQQGASAGGLQQELCDVYSSNQVMSMVLAPEARRVLEARLRGCKDRDAAEAAAQAAANALLQEEEKAAKGAGGSKKAKKKKGKKAKQLWAAGKQQLLWQSDDGSLPEEYIEVYRRLGDENTTLSLSCTAVQLVLVLMEDVPAYSAPGAAAIVGSIHKLICTEEHTCEIICNMLQSGVERRPQAELAADFLHEVASAGLPGLGSAPFVTNLWECVFQLAAYSSADASMRDNGVFPMALRVLHEASQSTAPASRAAYSLALEFIKRLSADMRVMEAATAPESGPADRAPVLELGFATLFAALKRPAGADRDSAILALTQLLCGSKLVAFFSAHCPSGLGMQRLLEAWGDCPDSWPLRTFIADCMLAVTCALGARKAFAHVPNGWARLAALHKQTSGAVPHEEQRWACSMLSGVVALCARDCEEARQVLKAHGMVMQVRLQLQHALALEQDRMSEEDASPHAELCVVNCSSTGIVFIGWLACALNQLVQPSEYQDMWPSIKDGVLSLAGTILSGRHNAFTYQSSGAANAIVLGHHNAFTCQPSDAAKAANADKLYMLRNAALCGLVADGLVHLEAPPAWDAWLRNALQMLRTAAEVARRPPFADSLELRGNLYTAARLVTAVLAASRKQGRKPSKAVQKLVDTSMDIGRIVGVALNSDMLKEAGSSAWHNSMLAGCRFMGELSLCAGRDTASIAALVVMQQVVWKLFAHGMRLLDATMKPEAASAAALDRIRHAASEAVMVLDKILSHCTTPPAAKYEDWQWTLWDVYRQSRKTALLTLEAQRVLEARLQRCKDFDEAEAAAQAAAEALLQEEEAAKEAKGSKKAKKKKAKQAKLAAAPSGAASDQAASSSAAGAEGKGVDVATGYSNPLAPFILSFIADDGSSLQYPAPGDSRPDSPVQRQFVLTFLSLFDSWVGNCAVNQKQMCWQPDGVLSASDLLLALMQRISDERLKAVCLALQLLLSMLRHVPPCSDTAGSGIMARAFTTFAQLFMAVSAGAGAFEPVAAVVRSCLQLLADCMCHQCALDVCVADILVRWLRSLMQAPAAAMAEVVRRCVFNDDATMVILRSGLNRTAPHSHVEAASNLLHALFCQDASPSPLHLHPHASPSPRMDLAIRLLDQAPAYNVVTETCSLLQKDADPGADADGGLSDRCLHNLWQCACYLAALRQSWTWMREAGAFQASLLLLHKETLRADLVNPFMYSTALTFVARLACDPQVMEGCLMLQSNSQDVAAAVALGLLEVFAALKRPPGRNRDTAIEALTLLLPREAVFAFLFAELTASACMQTLLDAWGDCPDNWKLRAKIANGIFCTSSTHGVRDAFVCVPDCCTKLAAMYKDACGAPKGHRLQARSRLTGVIALCLREREEARGVFMAPGIVKQMALDLRDALELQKEEMREEALASASTSSTLPLCSFDSGTGVFISWLAAVLAKIMQPSEYQNHPYVKDAVTSLANTLLSDGHDAFSCPPSAKPEPGSTAAVAGGADRIYVLRQSAMCDLVADGLGHLDAPSLLWQTALTLDHRLKSVLQLLRKAAELANRPGFADSLELRGGLYAVASLVTAVLTASRRQGRKASKAFQKLVDTATSALQLVSISMSDDALKEAGSRAWHNSMLAGCRLMGGVAMCAGQATTSSIALSAMFQMLTRLFAAGSRLLDAKTNPLIASKDATERIRDVASEAVMVMDKILSHYTPLPAANHEDMHPVDLWDAYCRSPKARLLTPEAQRALEARLQGYKSFEEAEAAAQAAADALLREEEAQVNQDWQPHVSLDEMECPITHEVMTDPVIAADGYTYERSAIEEWFETHDTLPMTNEVVESKCWQYMLQC